MKIAISRKTFNIFKFIYRIGGFILCLCILLTYSFIVNRLVEFIIMFTMFFITKDSYTSQYHTTSMKDCLVVSIVVFIVLTRVTLSKQYSIMISLLLGAFVPYISYRLSILKHNSDMFNKIQSNMFVPLDKTSFSREQLINACHKLNFSDATTKLAIELFIDKLPTRQLADKYCIQCESIRIQKYRLSKKLFK